MSDVAAKIIAEDERLRVEIDQLKHEWKKSREMLAVEQLITADRDAEIKRLQDEIKRLRAQVKAGYEAISLGAKRLSEIRADVKEIESLRTQIKRLRAQYDADPEPPSDEDSTGLCSVCGGASNQLRRRGKSWVCVGCWQEDCDGE